MKQIVDKLNKIAKKIDESVEIPQTDLIIDSLDAITKAYGGTPNDSNLIVDKLEDIYNNIEPAVSGNIEITENGENINVAPYATATVNVSGGGGDNVLYCAITLVPDLEGKLSTDDGTLKIENKLIYSAHEQFDIETVLLCPYFGVPAEIPDMPPLNYVPFDLTGSVVTASNAVNCEYDNGEIIVTDWTIPSSITLSGYTPK